MVETSQISRAKLESQHRLYRRLVFVLGALVLFLTVAFVGQMTINNTAKQDQAQTKSTTSNPDTKSTTSNSDANKQSPGSYQDSPLAKRDPDDPLAIGDVDAPIVLLNWTDLRCPFCAAFDRETLPKIVKEYVDTGKVRIETHDVAFFGDASLDAAVAARAAGEQGKFFEYVETLYAAAPESGHPDMPREKLVRFAQEAGVPDLDRFVADLDNKELRKAAEQSTTEAQQVGVNSVPFFVINNSAISGAQPIDKFREFLDDALKQAQ